MAEDFNRVLRDHDYEGTARSDTPFLAAECEINIGIQAVQDSIKNAEHNVDEIGFWRYGEPVLTTTSNTTLAAWWQDLTGRWDSSPEEDFLTDLAGTFRLPRIQIRHHCVASTGDFHQIDV